MGVEIERKFLLDPHTIPREVIRESVQNHLEQGFLSYHDPCVRIRVINHNEGVLTIKGPGALIRPEFNFPVSAKDARELLTMCKGTLSKLRHEYAFEGHLWEIDCFLGDLAGLWMVEVELSRPDEEVALPSWLGHEVTEDVRYTNAHLAEKGLP